MAKDLVMEEIIDNMVRDCMEDPDALSCAIEVIESIPSGMAECRPELVFFTREDCAVCDVDREKYSALIGEGTVREVSSDSAEGKRIMDRNNLKYTPSLAIIDCDGKLIGEFFDSNVVAGNVVDSTQGQS